MRPTSKVEALRVQLMDAQRAQQTAEVALAKEREANIAEGIRAMIDSAVRERMDAQHERDHMRHALDKAQRAVQYLEQRVARLMGENQSLGLSSQLGRNPSPRYSPLASGHTRHGRHRPARAPCSPTMPTISPPNLALSPSPTVKAESDDGRIDISSAEPLHSPSIDSGGPQPPLQIKWTPNDVPPNIKSYTPLGRLEPGIRVGINGVENPVDLHAYLWRYHLRQLQAHVTSFRDHYLYDHVNDHVDKILSRQGRYAELVAELFPDAPLDFSLDPATSKLGPEYMFDVSSLAHGDEIYEEDVVRWMYAVLNVSREAVRLELEPYFRRRAHYHLAVEALRDILIQGMSSHKLHLPVSLRGLRWELERSFHSFKPFAYPVHCGTTPFSFESGIVAWNLPDKGAEVEDVAVNLAWLPTCISKEVAVRYRELCIISGILI